MRKRKYQTEHISYPNLTEPKTMFKEISTDSAYDKIVGIAIYETGTGGIPYYRVGLDDKDQQYISAVHKDALMPKNVGFKDEDRFLKVDIKAGGHKIKFATEIPEKLTAELGYDVVLLLERSEN